MGASGSLPRQPRSSTRAPTERRRDAALAGYIGDEATARQALHDESPEVRIAALSSLVAMKKVSAEDSALVLADPEDSVRRQACEFGADLTGADFAPLLSDAPNVVEAAAFALGETGDRTAVPALLRIAREHADALCRESAVAALGALGDERAKSVLIDALNDAPAIRRRAAVALSAFDGDDVIAALEAHLDDRDWQARQACEEVLRLLRD